MNTHKIKQLYQKVILQHDRQPVQFEKREDASIILDAYNPICGDRFTLYLDIDGDVVTKATFHGYGCAISKAATSVLMDRIQGKPVAEILALCDQYLALLDPENPDPGVADAELSAFMGARVFPVRRQCASLAWEEIQRYLEEKGSV